MYPPMFCINGNVCCACPRRFKNAHVYTQGSLNDFDNIPYCPFVTIIFIISAKNNRVYRTLKTFEFEFR